MKPRLDWCKADAFSRADRSVTVGLAGLGVLPPTGSSALAIQSCGIPATALDEEGLVKGEMLLRFLDPLNSIGPFILQEKTVRIAVDDHRFQYSRRIRRPSFTQCNNPPKPLTRSLSRRRAREGSPGASGHRQAGSS